MPTIVNDFTRYSIHLMGGVPSSTGDVMADIDCFRSGKRVGLMRFFNEPPAASGQSFADGSVALYFAIARFADIVDVLRHEKPLRLVVNTDTGFCYLGTGETEPVGKLEPVELRPLTKPPAAATKKVARKPAKRPAKARK